MRATGVESNEGSVETSLRGTSLGVLETSEDSDEVQSDDSSDLSLVDDVGDKGILSSLCEKLDSVIGTLDSIGETLDCVLCRLVSVSARGPSV